MDIVQKLREDAASTAAQLSSCGIDVQPTDMLVGQAAALIASQAARIRELEAALTPSAETKAAYMGEFSFRFPAHDEEGNEVMFTPTVPWTTIREIMGAIRARSILSRKGGE